MTRVAQMLLATAVVLAAMPWASAQSATGFLGLAGVVRDGSNVAQNTIEIRVRNSVTGRTEVTTSPSTANAQTGFYFVALTDFSGNRAAQEGDTLTIQAFATSPSRKELKATPSSIVVTSGDVSSSLRKFDIKAEDVGTIDTTRPTISLTYTANSIAQDPSNIAPGVGSLAIVATASENITTTATVKIDIIDPQGVKTSPTVTRNSNTSFSVAYTVASTDTGLYTVAVSGANDNSGNPNMPATNNTFRVGTSSTNPTLAVSRVKGKGPVNVPVNLSTAGKQIGSMQFKILFDPTKASFTNAVAGQAAVASGYQIAFNVNPSNLLNVTVFGTADGGLPAGESAVLTFTTSSTVADGAVIALTVQSLDVSDIAAITLAADKVDGAITVGASSTGGNARPGQICFDVNNNGTPAESADITFLLNKSINRVVTRNGVTSDFTVCPAGTNNNGAQTCFDINQNGTPAESADITFLLNKSINRVVTRNGVTSDFTKCPAYTGP